MTSVIHTRTVGDTLTPIGVLLQQKDANGVLQPVDLTGLVVKVKIAKEDGTTELAPTTSGVTINATPTTGKVSYDPAAANVDTAGIYHIWFQVYNAGETEFDTFPKDGDTFKLILVQSRADT